MEAGGGEEVAVDGESRMVGYLKIPPGLGRSHYHILDTVITTDSLRLRPYPSDDDWLGLSLRGSEQLSTQRV